jgi:putative endonuclease
MYYIYVIKSLKNNRRYTGFTQKDPNERLREHNNGTNSYTKQNRPFKLIYFETFTEECKARRREKFLKTGQGKRFLYTVIPP